jgi:hypothetical protein
MLLEDEKNDCVVVPRRDGEFLSLEEEPARQLDDVVTRLHYTILTILMPCWSTHRSD